MILAALALIVSATAALAETNSLVWKNDRVDADVRNYPLHPMLENVQRVTGWDVFIEPGLSHSASVRFKDLAQADALRALLGNLNFALLPQSNHITRLSVFRTDVKSATSRIVGRDATGEAQHGKHVPNELIVRFKNKADADRWANLLGAKITGSISGLNAYRLEFTDAEAAESARERLKGSPEVLGVDSNYYIEPPSPAGEFTGTGSRPLSLKPKAGDGSGRVIIGLIDTAVQPMGDDLDAFMLKQISVAGQSTQDASTPSHGTSMAETVLRSLEFATKGSTSAQILPVDVYGSGEMSTTWNVAAGIVQAVNNGANVINLSLGGGSDGSILRDVIADVARRGIPIYAAAGNEPVSTPFYPAAYPEVTAVTALAGPVSSQQPARIASYANFGSFVDLAAPDGNVIYLNGKQFYVRGTSAASAYTAGLAAGIREVSGRSWVDVNANLKLNFGMPPTATKP